MIRQLFYYLSVAILGCLLLSCDSGYGDSDADRARRQASERLREGKTYRKARFTLSYTSKTKRPLYSQLSSAIQYDDRFTYETGNPHLVSFWSLYNSINLGKGFNMSADVTGRTRGDMDVVTLLSSWQLNVGLTRSFRGWFMQLQATDLFRTARNSMITHGEQMTLDKWNYSDTQALRLIVRYSFNTTMSKYKGKSAGMSERNRL